MISSIRGIVEHKAPDRLVINVGGIGIRVMVPTTVSADAGDVGDNAHLHTYLQVREDALNLYGFSTQEQLRLFELLISVTGVGPGHALSILSAGGTETVETAIATENGAFFSRVPRIGKRLAARIVLDLKDKVSPSADDTLAGVGAVRVDDEVLGALLGLGFTAGEANAMLRGLPDDPELSTEDKIRLALGHFSER